DPAAEEEAARGVDAQVTQALRMRRDTAVAGELRVLPDEAERHEFREPVGLLLDRPDELEVACDVAGRLDVAVHDGRRGRHAQAVRRRDDLDPRADGDLFWGQD